MRRVIFFAVISMFAMIGCSSQPSSPRKRVNPQQLVGSQAPELAAPDLTGKTHKLEEYAGKYVFLDFWATWCPPCIASVPNVKELEKDYRGKIEVVSISVDNDLDQLRSFIAANELRNLQLVAGDTGVDDRYGVRGIPSFVLVGPDGRILKIWQGFTPGDQVLWRQEIDRLLKA